MNRRICFLTLFGLLAGTSLAPAASYDFGSADFNSPDWTLVGSSFWVSDGGISGLGYDPERLRLTSNGGGLNGAAWLNTDEFDLSQSWNASFRGQITFRSGGGADGIGMHFHSDGLGANPSFEGGGLTGNRLTINVDTYQNPGESAVNSVEIFLNGGQLGFIDLGSVLNTGPDLDREFDLVANYDGSGILNVSFDILGDAPGPVSTNVAANLNSFTSGIWGFSASTGGSSENHDVTLANINTVVVPEPSSIALAACGMLFVALLGVRNRKSSTR